jgi:DNA polymerase-3 subunit epsilon
MRKRTETLPAGVPEGRLVVLDTETTGLRPEQGDAIVEIGCAEILDRKITGRVFHAYVNPLKELTDETVRIHGLTMPLLSGQPAFPAFIEPLSEFIDDSTVIIHNAPFDVGFLDAEMRRAGRGDRAFSNRFRVYDSLAHARHHLAQNGASLDALCRKFGIALDARKVHGALIDAWLLARVWLAMTAGQAGLAFGATETGQGEVSRREPVLREGWRPRVLRASEAEIAAHQAFFKRIEKTGVEPF